MQPLNAVLSYNIVQTTCKHNNDQSHAVYGKLNPTTVQFVVKNNAFLLTVHSLLHILNFYRCVSMCFAYLSLGATDLCEVQHVCICMNSVFHDCLEPC